MRMRLPWVLMTSTIALGHAWVLHALMAPPLQAGAPGMVATHPALINERLVYRVRAMAPMNPPPKLPAQRTTAALPHPAPTQSAPLPPPTRAGYFAAEQLDWPALPRAAPDTTRLDEQLLSGLPLRLRLYIDAAGCVTHVDALEIAAQDHPALPALQAMFEHTAYSPGRRQGLDVASYTDVALSVEPVVTASSVYLANQ